MRIRYGRWTGTQDPFAGDVTADEVLDAIGDDLLAGDDPQSALDRLLRSGFTRTSGRVPGLAELRERVEQARRRELSRMGLEGPLQEVAEELSRIVDAERAALELADLAGPAPVPGDGTAQSEDEAPPDDRARSDGPASAGGSADGGGLDARADRHAQLDALPDDVAGRIAALQQYEFFDARAAADFAALVERLRRDVAEATFGRLAQALGQADEADLARTRDLLAEINAMVAERERGEDITGHWQDFATRYADVLEALGNPGTLDELLEELARRMAAMSALMAGLSPEQRQQLAELAAGVLGDTGLAVESDQLQRTLQQQFPEMGWNQAPEGAPMAGPESGSLAQTVDWVERLQQMDGLGTALDQQYPGARLEDVDDEALRALVGEEAASHLEALRAIERALEEAGALQRHHGRLELTPRGLRRLGERALSRIFDRALDGQVGAHRATSTGGGGELTGSTRALRFGDPFRLDVAKTVSNAIVRGGRPPVRGRGDVGVRLHPDDFELAEAERRVRAATVLLLDMSFSMPLRGNWEPAKRVALALQALIEGRFPEDTFHVIGFSDYARRLAPSDLLVSGWERVYGTNMQHAFMLARRLLDGDPSAERQIIMVTDGEPTAHLEGERATFAWPPEPRTLRLTMREAARLARADITLNVFLLDHDPGAALFVEEMVSRCGGRIFHPDLADLGSVVVRDFLRRRGA